jgi:hypothetical protein
MKKICVLTVLVCLATTMLGQQRRIEITQDDFTKAETIRSTNLSVFGVYLSQPARDSSAAIKTAGLVWKESNGQVEVNDLAGKTLLMLFLVDGTVDSIVLQSNLADYLKGDEKKLFSPTIVEPQSSYRMELLGREDEIRRNTDSDMSEISYVYFKEGIRIQDSRCPNSMSACGYLLPLKSVDRR